MSWYQIELSSEDMASGKMAIIQDQYNKILTIEGSPVHHAIFASVKSIPNFIFFSPNAAKIAKHLIKVYDGIQCEQPEYVYGEIALLIGYDDDWALVKNHPA